MKRLLTLLLLNFLLLQCLAQSLRLKGTVRDAATDSCLSYVNVMLFTMPDSMLVSFATTDDNGEFSLEVPSHEHLLLKVTCLGYKEEKKEISSINSGNLSIFLHEDSKMLSTIVIKGRKPGIKVSGDTIDYDFDKYTDGTEKVLKDILAKLPGIDVDDKGQVTANGKLVNKILVNGQDFFGDHNEQITNNLPSNYIDKIQLQKNYNEYSFLKGFNASKAQALNVGIDSLYSGKVSGTVEGYGGYRDRYRMAGSLYYFGNKAMWGFNAKSYNTGEDMMTLLDYIKLQGSISDYARSFGGVASLIDNGLSTSSYIETDVSTFERKNTLLSVNVAWNPNENIKINTYYIFNSANCRGKYSLSREYHVIDEKEVLSQFNNNRECFHHLGYNMKINLAHNAAFDFRTKVTAMPQETNIDLGTINNRRKSTAWDLSQQLSFAKNWDNKNLLSIAGQFMYHHIGEDIEVISDSIALYGDDSGVFNANQNVLTAMLNNRLTASWINKFTHDWQLRTAVSWDYFHTSIEASSHLLSFVIPTQANSTNLFSCGLTAQKKRGMLQLDAGVDMAYIDCNHFDHRFALLPKVSLELALSSINSIALSYKSGYQKDEDYFVRGRIINDYRCFTQYNGEQDLLHLNHDVSISMNYFDILNDFNFVMNAGCVITKNPYIMSFDSNRNRTLVSVVKSSNSTQIQYANLNVKKGFLFPLVLSGKSTLSNYLYENAYGEIVSKNRFTKVEGEMKLATKMKTLFNAEIGGRFSFNQSKSGIDANLLNMVSWETWLRPFLVKKGKYDVSIPISYIYDRVVKEKYHYVNCSLSASFQTGSWSFSIEGKNIFHPRNFRRVSINTENDYSETVIEYRMPGYIIAGAKLSF